MNKENLCPVCSISELEQKTSLKYVEYEELREEYASIHGVCNHCGAEAVTSFMAEQNKKAHSAARKKLQPVMRARNEQYRKEAGLLTGEEIRAMREKLDINQQEAAALFGGGIRAFSKYEKGDVIQNESMDRLIRVACEVHEARAWLIDKYTNHEFSLNSSKVFNLLTRKIHDQPSNQAVESKTTITSVRNSAINNIRTEIEKYAQYWALSQDSIENISHITSTIKNNTSTTKTNFALTQRNENKYAQVS